MAKKRYINTKFWDDTAMRKLSPEARFIFLYLLTNPLTDLSGLYEIGLDRIAFDTGYDTDTVQQSVYSLSQAGRIVYTEGWVCILNFVKHQAVNDSIKKGISRSLESVPENIIAKISEEHTEWVQSVYRVYTGCDLLKPILTPKPNGTSEQSSPDKKPMYEEQTIELDAFGEVVEHKATPKLYKNKSKFYHRLAYWLCDLKGENHKSGARYFKDLKIISEMVEGEQPDIDEKKIELEIKSRIYIFKLYQESKELDWSTGGVIKHWNRILDEYQDKVEFNSTML